MSFALVIDDNRNTADALVQMMDVLSIPARAAYGASPAMAILGNQTPNLVFLDINMPGVDGLEILAYLRREPRLVSVPVIIISSDDQPETRENAMKGGAQVFIVKPVTIDQIESALKEINFL